MVIYITLILIGQYIGMPRLFISEGCMPKLDHGLLHEISDPVYLSLPVRKYRKSYCFTPGISIGIGIGGCGINKNVKISRQSL